MSYPPYIQQMINAGIAYVDKDGNVMLNSGLTTGGWGMNMDAKFMTASDILGKLKLWGNIERVMPINKFGQLLQKRGFAQTKYCGIKGYIVVENSTPSQSQKEIAKKLLSQNVY